MSTPEAYEVRFQKLETQIQELKETLSTRFQPESDTSLAEEIISRLDSLQADHARDIDQLRTEVKNIPHFDWKWFLGIVIPIIFFIVVASVTFHGRLTAMQRDINHIQSDLTETNKRLDGTNKRIDVVDTRLSNRMDSLETRVRGLEVGQATIIGELKLINEKLDVLKKP